MKTPLGNKSTMARYSLIVVLLLAVSAWTFSISAAQQQPEQGQGADTGQALISSGDTQQSQPAPPADQNSASQPTMQQNASTEQISSLEPPNIRQLSDLTVSQPEPAEATRPPEYAALIQKTAEALKGANFTFLPAKPLDPFVPFILPTQSGLPEEDEPQNGSPMTPLQRMTMSEIEKGLKAITWGDLGKRAVIEDSTGRGYIVAIGTPAGEHSGVITQIYNDRLVVQQEIWDRRAKKRFPQDFTIKLVKKTDEKPNLGDVTAKP